MKAAGAGLALAIGFAVVAAAQTTVSSPDRANAVSPDWIGKPTLAELMASYPSNALDHGKSGQALVACVVDNNNRLKNCAVLAENPRNEGFGRAALKLTDRFEAAPGSAGGEVTIPIDWVVSAQPSTRTILAKTPHFIGTPSVAEVLAAFPAAAKGHVERGLVRLRCAPRGCVVSGAEPAQMGFEDAALKLSKKFRLDPVWWYNLKADVAKSGAAIEIQYDLVMQFAPSDSEVWKTRPLGHIDWVESADPQMAQAAFPASALSAGLSSGSAVVSCVVAPTGALTACGVESEDPQGLGFGPAVVKVAERYALNPWTDEGLPAAGAHVRLPMKLVHEPDPAASPTPATKP